MKEKKPKPKDKKKVAYTAPEVTRVSLRPEEAVLGHCKTSGSMGPGNATCRTLFCKTVGS